MSSLLELGPFINALFYGLIPCQILESWSYDTGIYGDVQFSGGPVIIIIIIFGWGPIY